MNMDKIEKLGFNNWFSDKVDLSKNSILNLARVITIK
jgi:hypothetical protein